LSWAKRIGGDNNDKANGLTVYNGDLFLVGESDSTGWSFAKTDMIYIKIDIKNTDAISWIHY
jgi:hypothetical protein